MCFGLLAAYPPFAEAGNADPLSISDDDGAGEDDSSKGPLVFSDIRSILEHLGVVRPIEIELQIEDLDARIAELELLKLQRDVLHRELEAVRRQESEQREKVEAALPKQIKPRPLFVIPDDPPPNEGAMISYPIAVEPPDIIVIEVLEALPGRPITGERLIRPDGTISLDFYGKFHIAGLEVDQVKAKVVQHLRTYLSDQTLGLIDHDRETGEVIAVSPYDTHRVFVDISAYNHLVYHVLGDVGAPGQLPFAGFETVLNALNYAGGLAPTADRNNVRLVRPARGDAPARIYQLDLDAIYDKGAPTANLQVFPGDRIIAGRHTTVERTIAIDRLTAAVNSLVQTIVNVSFAFQHVSKVLNDSGLTADYRRSLVNEWVEIVWPIMTEGEAAELDKDRLREILLHGFVPEAAQATKP